MEMKSEHLFDLRRTLARDALVGRCPWELLPALPDLIRAHGRALSRDAYTEISPDVFVAKTVRIDPGAVILAPCIIGAGSEIRHGAVLRGSALIGEGCVVGNSSEVKNSILFDGVKLPHWNYAGDSVLGAGVHLGAGAILSNLRLDRAPVTVLSCPPTETGLRKLGAILGDGCEVGCHAVLNPGTVLFQNCTVLPLTSVCGVHARGSRIGGDRT